jgi:amino acid transporter
MADWMGESSSYLVIMSDAQSFVLGLIQGAYCLSPTGMLASMAEEVKNPEVNIPRAM